MDTALNVIGWWCPSGRGFPLHGPLSGPASRWGPWSCLVLWPSGWSWGSFSGGTAGWSVRTVVMVPLAGLLAGTGSPSSCGPAVLPVSSSACGGVPPGAAADLVVHLVDVRLRAAPPMLGCRMIGHGAKGQNTK